VAQQLHLDNVFQNIGMITGVESVAIAQHGKKTDHDLFEPASRLKPSEAGFLQAMAPTAFATSAARGEK
jgi:hypothetical protein